MMSTDFEKCLKKANKIPEENLDEACRMIMAKEPIPEFLDFCLECECFPEEQYGLLVEGIHLRREPETNLFTADSDNLRLLMDAVGATQEVLDAYARKEEEKDSEEDDEDGDWFDDSDWWKEDGWGRSYASGRRCPSATAGDYSPSCPWNAPGMSIKDFI